MYQQTTGWRWREGKREYKIFLPQCQAGWQSIILPTSAIAQINLILIPVLPGYLQRRHPSDYSGWMCINGFKRPTFICCHFTWAVFNGRLFYPPLPSQWPLTEVLLLWNPLVKAKHFPIIFKVLNNLSHSRLCPLVLLVSVTCRLSQSVMTLQSKLKKCLFSLTLKKPLDSTEFTWAKDKIVA